MKYKIFNFSYTPRFGKREKAIVAEESPERARLLLGNKLHDISIINLCRTGHFSTKPGTIYNSVDEDEYSDCVEESTHMPNFETPNRC